MKYFNLKKLYPCTYRKNIHPNTNLSADKNRCMNKVDVTKYRVNLKNCSHKHENDNAKATSMLMSWPFLKVNKLSTCP